MQLLNVYEVRKIVGTRVGIEVGLIISAIFYLNLA
jgi:hypothetical protein